MTTGTRKKLCMAMQVSISEVALQPKRLSLAEFVGYIVALTTTVAPFNALVAVGFAGELSGELYFLVQLAFLPVVALAVGLSYRSSISRHLLLILILLLISILLSFIANYTSIQTDQFRGRSAMEKMLSSSAVVVFGIYYATVIFFVASVDLRRFILRPLIVSISIVIFVGLAQLVTLLVPGTQSAYSAAFGWINGATRSAGEVASGRIHSVLFEPAAFGSYMVYVLPWLIFVMTTQRGALAKLTLLFMLLISLLLCAFSGTLALGGGCAVVAFYFFVYVCIRWIRSSTPIFVMLLLIYLAPLFLLLTFSSEFSELLIRSHSNSSLTRFGTVVTLLNEFRESPLFGVGMGQYAFHLFNNIPVWGYTWEFNRWMTDPTASFFPTFSVFARIAGELGIFGLIVWLGSFFWIGRQAVVRALSETSYVSIMLGITVVTSFFSIGLNGWGEASFRGFGLWSTIGIAAAYIQFPRRPLVA